MAGKEGSSGHWCTLLSDPRADHLKIFFLLYLRKLFLVITLNEINIFHAYSCIFHSYKICIYEKYVILLHLHIVSTLNILSPNSMWARNDRIKITQVLVLCVYNHSTIIDNFESTLWRQECVISQGIKTPTVLEASQRSVTLGNYPPNKCMLLNTHLYGRQL